MEHPTHQQHQSFKKMLNNNIIQFKLSKSLCLMNNYSWLLDSYLLDFFVDDHWNKLPLSWKETFCDIKPLELAELLITNNNNNVKKPTNSPTKPRPLSILCIQILLNELCIPRRSAIQKLMTINHHQIENKYQRLNKFDLKMDDRKLMNLFFKNVKSKKRHEILRMAEHCSTIAKNSNVKYILDFGSGVGHLARILNYKYGLKICCLEQQIELSEQAMILDNEFEKNALKYFQSINAGNGKLFGFDPKNRPKHLNKKLTTKTNVNSLLQDILNAFDLTGVEQKHSFRFGIVGLHTCGDLVPILIDIFLKCKQAKFLNVIGCCYMKLTTCEKTDRQGYPLSNYTKMLKQNHCLSYESREIACHACENYSKRLWDFQTNDYDEYLRIQCYRATIEEIIIKYWPHLKHSGLKSIKYKNGLTFYDYCRIAVPHLNIQIADDDIQSRRTQSNLNKWKLVIIFYTLRLMFAPLIESILLLDRLLYIHEQLNSECTTEINAIFNPEISPRNLILTAIKN